MKLLFIGAGNMGQAIIGGIIKNEIVSAQNIFIYEINPATSQKVIDTYNVNKLENLNSSISYFDIIVLAIKPQVFNNLKDNPQLKTLCHQISKNQLIVSIMAGVTIEKISTAFTKDTPIIRIMPNTPALIGESMSAIAISKQVNDEQLTMVKKIFESVGKIELVEEKALDAVTAISGCGPAYVYMFVEALTQGGILCGLTKTAAENLAVQTLKGAALMVEKSDTSVEDLRHQVTSPGGVTIEAVSVLEKNNFRSTVIEAVRAAFNKSQSF